MNVVVFKTNREKQKGLIGMSPIPADTVFVFPGTRAGGWFHSRGVLEPFDIAFLDADKRVLKIDRVYPPRGLAQAPPGTKTAVEGRPGILEKIRFV